MNYDKQNNYNELFKTDKDKANAFDQIAQCYYFGNFGKMSKTDFDVLMFSIYLEKILEKNENDMNSYSDYKLSKLLGITQSKVSNLKVKKELAYPYKKFDWKKSFSRLLEKARFDDGKIKINIPDKNLYNEIKNAIEVNGGYVEKQLNSSLLQVPVEYYLDLVYSVSDDKEKEKIISKLNKAYHKEIASKEKIENESIRDIFKNGVLEGAKDIFKGVTCEFIKERSPLLANFVKEYVFKI